MIARILAWGALSAAMGAGAAAPVPSRFRFSERQLPGAEQCVAPGALRDAVAILLGYDPFDARAGPSLEVEIRPRLSGFEALVALRDADGNRVGGRKLAGGRAECGELTNALALTIGNAIDPVSAARAAAKPTRPLPARPPPPAVSKAPGPRPQPGEKLSLLGSLGLLGAAGAAPGLNAGVLLELELRWPRYSLALGGRADFPASAGYRGGSVGGELLVAEIAPCLRLSRFGACLLAALGSESAQATGLPGATTVSAVYAAAGARVLFDLIVPGPVGLRTAVDILAPVTREAFVAAGAIAYSTPPVAVALSFAGVIKVF